MGATPSSSNSTTARFGVLAGAIIVQLILGTVYGYSIFWQPLTAEVFPEVITEAEQTARLASGIEVSGVEVVADDEVDMACPRLEERVPVPLVHAAPVDLDRHLEREGERRERSEG